MTVAAACIVLGSLLMYCGIKGKSLKSAIVGKSEAGGTGSIIQSGASS